MPGIARQLASNYNYPREEALTLATDLLNPNQRCGICGIPGWLVQFNSKRGLYFLGGKQHNVRLHPDRINTREPHTLANTRILCPTCNIRRGAERYTDEEVLRWVRYRWLSLFPHKKLWWLNTEPGVGGRLYRSPAVEKRDASYNEVKEAFE